MKFILTLTTVALLSVPVYAATNAGSYHPCERAHWLAWFGLDPALGQYCGAPALGDPDTSGIVSHPAKPRAPEPEPEHCPKGWVK